MAHDPFDLAAQQAAEDEAQERAKLAAKTEEDDLRWLMSSKRGRRIAYRMLEQAGVFRLSFNQNAMTMAFNEGQRNLGLALTSKLTNVCPDLYVQMLRDKENA